MGGNGEEVGEWGEVGVSGVCGVVWDGEEWIVWEGVCGEYDVRLCKDVLLMGLGMKGVGEIELVYWLEIVVDILLMGY